MYENKVKETEYFVRMTLAENKVRELKSRLLIMYWICIFCSVSSAIVCVVQFLKG